VLTTGTGSIFGFLVARQAYQSALLAPLFIVLSFGWGLAVFLIVQSTMYAWNGQHLMRRSAAHGPAAGHLRRRLAVPGGGVPPAPTCTSRASSAFEIFILRDGGVYPWLFWGGYGWWARCCRCCCCSIPALGSERDVLLAAVLVVGAFAWLYVFIIGGQAFPLEIFPGHDVRSAFGTGRWMPTCPLARTGCWALGGLGAGLPADDHRRARARLHAAGRLPVGQALTDHAAPAGLRRAQVLGQDHAQHSAWSPPGRRRAWGATFKKGPDYIDPMWLVAGRRAPCFNLDPYLMGDPPRWCAAFARRPCPAPIWRWWKATRACTTAWRWTAATATRRWPRPGPAGAAGDRRARHDARHRAADPGLPGLRPAVRIAGVILNRVGGSPPRSQAARGDRALHRRAGARRGGRGPALAMTERHLGLMPCAEGRRRPPRCSASAASSAQQVDLDRCCGDGAGRQRRAWPACRWPRRCAGRSRAGPAAVRIGIARWTAPSASTTPTIWLALQEAGAELVPIDTLHDAHLPPLDGLFIGGGFPETSAAATRGQTSLRSALQQAIEGALPTYAECGGLMLPVAQHHAGTAQRADGGRDPG
jgi:hypothetical protein